MRDRGFVRFFTVNLHRRATHKNSPSSAWKTPSAMNFLFLEICEEVAILK
jgi:hypothetical protein